MSCRRNHLRAFGSPKGSVTLEFALIVAFVLPVLIFGIIDFGRLIYARQVVNDVSRLGGGLVFWRAEEYGYRDIADTQEAVNLLDLLQDAGAPILTEGNEDKWKIIISKIEGAWQQGASPTIADQHPRGNLSISSSIGQPGESPNQDALRHTYSHLTFDTVNQAPDKSELGVVEVFYRFEPITPLPNFIEGILQMDDGGVIIRSCKAFY